MRSDLVAVVLFSHIILQTDTKESKWDMPDELLLLLEKVEKEQASQPPPVYASSLVPLLYTLTSPL